MTSAARRSALVLSTLSMLVIAGCSHDSTAPVNPVSVENSVTAVPSATVGTALATAPTFVVKDANGNALSNVGVTVTVASGGGTLTGAPTRTSSGPTSVGTWVLGTTAGTNTLSVVVSGLSTSLVISATGTAGPPSKVVVASGANQSAAATSSVASPIVVKVTDQYGNGVAGQPVAFAITAGGGSLSGSATATSDASGSATAPTWFMGKTNVPQVLSVTSGAASINVAASIATNYTVVVRFYGGTPDPVILAAFQAAVARITAIATGQLSSVSLSNFNLDDPQGCATTGVGSITETISGLVIYATVGTLPNGVLGQAGPCGLRDKPTLPAVGVMKFSSGYLQTMIANGILTDVVTHEMLHVLGFGSIWELNQAQFPTAKLFVNNAGTSSTAFNGVQAIAACSLLPGATSTTCTPGIPLTYGIGAGSDDSHWRESVFGNELMTHAINRSPNPLSAMTIASMADLGYTVNMNVADSYTIPSAALASLQTLRAAQGMGLPSDWTDDVVRPTWSIDAGGRATRIVRY